MAIKQIKTKRGIRFRDTRTGRWVKNPNIDYTLKGEINKMWNELLWLKDRANKKDLPYDFKVRQGKGLTDMELAARQAEILRRRQKQAQYLSQFKNREELPSVLAGMSKQDIKDIKAGYDRMERDAKEQFFKYMTHNKELVADYIKNKGVPSDLLEDVAVANIYRYIPVSKGYTQIEISTNAENVKLAPYRYKEGVIGYKSGTLATVINNQIQAIRDNCITSMQKVLYNNLPDKYIGLYHRLVKYIQSLDWYTFSSYAMSPYGNTKTIVDFIYNESPYEAVEKLKMLYKHFNLKWEEPEDKEEINV